MRPLMIALLMAASFYVNAQVPPPKKTPYIFVINDTIATSDQLKQIVNAAAVKSLERGVSEEKMKVLKEINGDKIGDDRNLIMTITLLTEEEKKQQALQPRVKAPGNATDEGYILKVDDKAADFTVQLLDGEKVKLSALKGKVVLLNFWATWCSPCMMEFNELPSKILQPFKDKDFVFLAVSRGEARAVVSKTMVELRNKGIDFNPGIDTDKSIWGLYGTVGIPKNYLIDKEGVIRYVSTGYTESGVDYLAKEISKLLKQ
ncbi:TlpA disulfide reductase family protein [Paraflavitalea sp. CAU 1676]|uniref:peroxiredoxin family protein n=1 Tax=Paraflavitalea sp. CAU 1676 TaxID=3032598 RepID=UPI0023DC4190|nr:TlpA disulfide reductase family protein [Paraflavitalea sp. CAU 1676]MDF2188522.1 TlpA disulfide reductase family protein [Paraflavitalea sp. CAU 1676]